MVLDQSGRKLAISKQKLMGKVQKRSWTSSHNLEQGSADLQTYFDRPLNDCEQAKSRGKNGVKTWKKLVAAEHDVEFEYFDRFEWPVLAYQRLSLPFSDVFYKNGLPFNKNGCKKSGGMGQDMIAFFSMSVYDFGQICSIKEYLWFIIQGLLPLWLPIR